MNVIEERPGGVLLRVRVQPRASRNAVLVDPDSRIRVTLTSPPVAGAANRALIEVLARKLGIPKGAVALVRGEKSRDKTLSLVGMTAAEVRAILDGS